jgi:sugar phosphate isomerase/epimerase
MKTMKTIKGPGIFLAQFLREEEPYNNIGDICKWAANLGYKGIQIPSWDHRAIDLQQAAESKDYCDEYKGRLAGIGMEVIELGSYTGAMPCLPSGL